MTTNWKFFGTRPGRQLGRTRRRRALVLGLSMFTAAAVVVQPLSPAPTATAAAVGEVREGGPVILDGTDSGLHGSIVFDGTGEPKASELRSTWIYELKAWETLLAGVPDGYAHNGKVALIGATPSTATSNNCGAAAGYVSERLATGPITVDYFDGAIAIGEFFDAVLAGTANYQLIQIVEEGWCSNGMDPSEETVVNARGPEIAAHVNRGGALFAQSQSYGWLNSLFSTLSASTSGCSGSSPELTDAGFAQFPGLSNSDIAAPWHNCFVDSSGTFPLTQLALQDGTHTVILGGDSVSLPSSVTVTTSPEQPRPGEEVCATATVTDGPDGAPVEGASVDFFVDGVLVATVLTDASGEAQYCYIAEESGEDDVTATVSDGTGTGTGTTTVTWSDVALSATPSASQPRGNDVCVVAAVASVTGGTSTPASGVTVDFSVDGVNAPAPVSAVTDSSGNAQYCYDGVNGGNDIVTASLGADERGILITWTGARVEVVDVSQPVGQSGKVVPISIDEFTGAIDLFVTLSLPADSGTLSVDATGLSLAFTGDSSGTTVEFSGTASAVTTALGSRVTWAAPATPGDVTMTAVVADAATSPTMSATDTGTLTTTAPPSITTQPESMTVDSGTTATFTSAAPGSPAPTATWQVSTDDGATWVDVAGGNTADLSFTTSNDMDGNQYRVKWTNSVGNVTSSAATLTVNPVIAPVFTDETIATIIVGEAFHDGVVATGSPAPTYSVTDGSLPTGLTLDADTGAIAGVATGGGAYSVSITATNSAGTVSVLLTGTVEHAPGAFAVTSLGSLAEGEAVSVSLAVTGQPAPTYAVTDGQLPAGLTLDPATGSITGTPTSSGPYQVTITATNAHGTSSQAFEGTVVVADGGFLGMDPVRLFDSRDGSRLAANTTHEVLVVDHGVPTDATSVVLNVTVVRPQASGYLTVFPCGIDRPMASNINFVAGATVANQVTAKIGTDDEVCLFTTAGTDLVVDVNGAYSASAGTGHLTALSPNRLFDSRDAGSKVAAEAVTELLVAGRGGVPADATSVVLNLTATQGVDDGYVVVFPCGGEVPLASNLNFLAGQTVPNAVTAAVGDDGEVCLYSTATTHLVVDVNGAYSPTEGDGPVVPLTPARLLDTRLAGEKVVALDVFDLVVTEADGVPAGAVAVMLNVTVAQPETAGFVTVFPCGSERPLASHVNFVAGRNTANAVTTAVGDDGEVCLYSTATTHLVVDVSGAQQP